MKKNFLTVLLLTFAIGAMAEAPSNRHDFELTLGEPTALWMTQWMYQCGCGPADLIQWTYDADGNVIGHDDSYRWLGEVLLPSVNFKYHYNRSEVFSMGVLAGYNMHYTLFEFPSDGQRIRQQDHNLYALFSMRWHWKRTEKLQCYSGLGIGMGLEIYNKDHDPVSKFTFLPLPALQLTFVGLKVGSGNKYWTAEIGYGDLGFFNTGIGFRL